MKYVEIVAADAGYSLKSHPYTDALPGFVRELPSGAADFASDPGHYAFTSPRCVKDLRLLGFSLSGPAGRLSLEVRFAPNPFKHLEGLVISYEDVTKFVIDSGDDIPAEAERDLRRHIGDVQLDEVLPHAQGISHEIALTGGVIRVVSADLRARWQPV